MVVTLKLARKIRSIFLAAPELTRDTTIDQAMKNIIDYVCTSLVCEKAVVYSLDAENRVLHPLATIGEHFPSSIKLGQDIAGIAAEKNNIMNIR